MKKKVEEKQEAIKAFQADCERKSVMKQEQEIFEDERAKLKQLALAEEQLVSCYY